MLDFYLFDLTVNLEPCLDLLGLYFLLQEPRMVIAGFFWEKMLIKIEN